jgi:hypothetical protein
MSKNQPFPHIEGDKKTQSCADDNFIFEIMPGQN